MGAGHPARFGGVNTRRSWLIFAFGSFVYLSAVLQRSSLGIAGVAATERFGGSAAVLSSLALWLTDTELFAYGVRDHPRWTLTTVVTFPFGLVPLIHTPSCRTH